MHDIIGEYGLCCIINCPKDLEWFLGDKTPSCPSSMHYVMGSQIFEYDILFLEDTCDINPEVPTGRIWVAQPFKLWISLSLSLSLRPRLGLTVKFISHANYICNSIISSEWKNYLSFYNPKWFGDPSIEDIRSYWKLCILAKQPLFRLDWNPFDYQCTYPFTGNNFNFFQYSELLGRHVLSDRQDVFPITFRYWSQ